jgi:hypothetical protein
VTIGLGVDAGPPIRRTGLDASSPAVMMVGFLFFVAVAFGWPVLLAVRLDRAARSAALDRALGDGGPIDRAEILSAQ